jgi:TetR/AcrR family transcriptional regulator
MNSTSSHIPPADGPALRRERRKDARPGELLDAALALFVEKGYAATRVEEVAHQAGVSKGTLFLYFDSKEALFKAVVRQNISGHFSSWRNALPNFQGNSAELLRHFMDFWWQRIGATKASGISKLMMSEASNFPELASFYQQEVIQPGVGLIQRILQRGIERGEFRAINPTYGAFTILAPMLFLATWRHSMGACTTGFDLVPQDYLATQIETLLHGLCIASDSHS